MKVSFERRKIAKVYMTHVQVFFRKSLSKATFERKLSSVSLALAMHIVDLLTAYRSLLINFLISFGIKSSHGCQNTLVGDYYTKLIKTDEQRTAVVELHCVLHPSGVCVPRWSECFGKWANLRQHLSDTLH